MGELPRGVQGYPSAVDVFVRASQSLRFEEVCSLFADFLPSAPARVLDAGAGAGQNAAAMAALGHHVDAVEPFAPFRDAAARAYGHHHICWRPGALPHLDSLGDGATCGYGFILVEGVWHHLDTEERAASLSRLSALLCPSAHLCISLRHGPPGLGTHVFPTSVAETCKSAREVGLQAVATQEHQPSIMAGKTAVTWSRVVLARANG